MTIILFLRNNYCVTFTLYSSGLTHIYTTFIVIKIDIGKEEGETIKK